MIFEWDFVDFIRLLEAYSNKTEGKVEDLRVNFINVKEFIKNKKATGRPKDLADIAALIKENE